MKRDPLTEAEPIRPNDAPFVLHPAGCECGQHPFEEPAIVPRTWEREVRRMLGVLTERERDVLASLHRNRKAG